MDGVRFDALTRSLTDARSRRGTLVALLGGALAVFGVAEAEAKKGRKPTDSRGTKNNGGGSKTTRRDTARGTASHAVAVDAKKKKKKCPPCKKRKQGKCKGRLPDGSACSGGSCQRGSCVAAAAQPPGPTCNDGVQNGGETGVDCGGPCARCLSGQGCASRNDCASAFCHDNGTCQVCSASDCPADGNGSCFCGQPTTPGSTRVCLKSSTTPNGDSSGLNCKCPPGTFCHIDQDFPGTFKPAFCHKPCGGGCGDAGANCGTEADCCVTSCMDPGSGPKVCASPPGGRCTQASDCASCRRGVECASACNTAGICTCPEAYDCCTNADCNDPQLKCDTEAFGLNGKCVLIDFSE